MELEDENDLLVLTHQDLKEKIHKLQNPQVTTEKEEEPKVGGSSTGSRS